MPIHATVLACADTRAGSFALLEDELVYAPDHAGESNSRIRAEIVHFETGHAGSGLLCRLDQLPLR
jgi:hypothetical protein